jgi:hypothetical protein
MVGGDGWWACIAFMVSACWNLNMPPICLAFVEIFAQFFTYTQCRKYTQWN